MSGTRYRLSFSSGGLLYNESLLILDTFQHARNWAATRSMAVENNLLQSRTVNSSKRKTGEVIARIRLLTEDQLNLLRSGSSEEQRYLLWLAACKHYTIIYEFAVEVLLEKFLRLDLLLEKEEYETFFEEKAQWNEELERVKPSTRKRTQQVLFQMLREAGIISSANMIIPALPSRELVTCLFEEDPKWLRVLPVSEADIKNKMG